MSLYIAGFICALVLAALVVAWIAYCMFVREKHKSEHFQYNISDLQHKNYVLGQHEEATKTEEKTEVTKITAGVFILPSLKNKWHDEKYDKRPDYPESPAPVSHPSTDKLIEILNDVDADVHYRDGIYEVDSAAYQSEV